MLLAFPLFCFAFNAKLDTTSSNMRVLGYFFSHNNWADDFSKIDLTKVSDINLAFLQPDSNGNFTANEDFTNIINEAHRNHVRVFMSIGGGDPPSYLAKLLKPANRTAFITKLIIFATQYNLDGIDADLENNLVNDDYAPFITQLSTAVKPVHKLLTAAIAAWSADKIPDVALQKFDFINIMSYDKTGPWKPLNAGQHAPFEMVQSDFEYFNITRKIPAAKLLIGLPFYGYGFGAGAPESMDYKTIVATYPGAEKKDQVTLPEGGIIYYNGMATIQQKVDYAINNKAAGVMIWQVLGDSSDSTSLLGVINNTIGR